jgi:hypothetical protein
MRAEFKRLYTYLLIYGICIALIFTVVTSPIVTTNADFSIYNIGWNGCSNIAIKTYQYGKLLPTLRIEPTDTEIQVVQYSFLNYQLDARDTSILIIGPELAYTDDECEYIRTFISAGGLVCIADDFGTGNQLLEKIGAETRIAQGLLVDLAFDKRGEFVVAFNFSAHKLTAGVSQILLNYPSALDVAENSTSLVSSSEESWLDLNLNHRYDASSEPRGPLPIFAVEKLGAGELLILSDPSILINSMRTYLDNDKFHNNLITYLCENRSNLIIDECHRETEGMMKFIIVPVTSMSTEEKFYILIAICILFVIIGTDTPKLTFNWARHCIKKHIKPFGRRARAKHIDPDTLVTAVMRRHPDWNQYVLLTLVHNLRRVRNRT